MRPFYEIIKKIYITTPGANNSNLNVKLLEEASDPSEIKTELEIKNTNSSSLDSSSETKEIPNISILKSVCKAYVSLANQKTGLFSNYLSDYPYSTKIDELSKAADEKEFFNLFLKHFKELKKSDLKKEFMEFISTLCMLYPKQLEKINPNFFKESNILSNSSPFTNDDITTIVDLIDNREFSNYDLILNTLESVFKNLAFTNENNKIRVEVLNKLIKKSDKTSANLFKNILFSLPENLQKPFLPTLGKNKDPIKKLSAAILNSLKNQEEKNDDLVLGNVSGLVEIKPELIKSIFDNLDEETQDIIINDLILILEADPADYAPYLEAFGDLFSENFEKFHAYKLSLSKFLLPLLKNDTLDESLVDFFSKILYSLPNNDEEVTLKKAMINKLFLMVETDQELLNPSILRAIYRITRSLPTESQMDNKTIKYFLELMESDTSWDNKKVILQSLGDSISDENLTQKAHLQLIKSLQDGNDDITAAAAKSIANISNNLESDSPLIAESIPRLTTLLGNTSVRVTTIQKNTAEALGTILLRVQSSPLKDEAVKALLAELDDDDLDYKSIVAQALVKAITSYPIATRWQYIETITQKLLLQLKNPRVADSATMALICMVEPMSEAQKNQFVYGVLGSHLDNAKSSLKPSDLRLRLIISEICFANLQQFTIAKKLTEEQKLPIEISTIIAKY